ncbi:MAG: hypothetical protein ACD_63C00014G0008 [uncultured bacterium]|nr:MAG: hypothetical protein ACD_63C00014G0008 [uncultured bacterium]
MEKRFASRAGEKLQFALEHFKLDVKNFICADLGSDRGGFTDCLLKNGAKKIYAVEKGYGLLDWNLRNDSRVEVMERTNALYAKLPEKVDIVTIDVGWTKQGLIIPKALEMLKIDGKIVSLIKPQYEAKKNQIRKGKVIEEFLPEILKKVQKDIGCGEKLDCRIIKSPIIGKRGENIEYLALVEFLKAV